MTGLSKRRTMERKTKQGGRISGKQEGDQHVERAAKGGGLEARQNFKTTTGPLTSEVLR